MSLSADLSIKSLEAAVAVIEVYNKPRFSYREEAFALLMANAWELLLKAKWLSNNNECADSLYTLVDDGCGGRVPKKNRSGNPLSHGAIYLAAKLKDDKRSGLEQSGHDNLLSLFEIRDNAAHFINKDPYIAKGCRKLGPHLMSGDGVV